MSNKYFWTKKPHIIVVISAQWPLFINAHILSGLNESAFDSKNCHITSEWAGIWAQMMNQLQLCGSKLILCSDLTVYSYECYVYLLKQEQLSKDGAVIFFLIQLNLSTISYLQLWCVVYY